MRLLTSTPTALAILLISIGLGISSQAKADSALSGKEADSIAVEAYVYFYPIISMDVTRRVTTNVPSGVKPGCGPMNAFHHMVAFPTADFRDVVRPNFDTLYSSAWIDLTKEPMIISTPAGQT